MKKMRKIFAMLLALTMVLGMSVTAFAAEKATIKINNAGSGKFSHVQVIEADQTTDTGWDFVDGYAQFFTAPDAFNTDDTQEIIKGLIFAENPAATEGKKIADFVNKYAAALKKVWDAMPVGTEDSTIEVSAAGLYVIKGSETNYNYNPMAVFIGMSYESGKPTGVVDSATVEAKKAPTHIEKEVDDTIVETNQEVTYTVTSTVPYFPDQDTNRWYIIKDTIKGADYVLNDEEKLTVSVKIGDGSKFNKTYDVTPTDVSDGTADQTFTLDLTDDPDLDLDHNKYANQTIEITYKAIVKGLVIDNDVIIGEGTHGDDDKYGSDHEDVISGTVTLVKTDDNENEENRIPLAGAEFVVQKTTNDNDTPDDKTDDTVVYAKFDNNNYLTGWTENIKEATVLTTNNDGEITVNGLAPDTAYEFKETKAPEGYSINETNATVTWDSVFTNKTDEEKEEQISDDAASAITGDASMKDTKLASLPGTGGIGTTIFTIGGCAIMIAAAGLYFASRRRQESR